MRVYSTEHRESMSYVSADGNYGSDEILVFPYDALTEQQWERLGETNDYERINYVKAILNGEDLSEWEQDWDQNDKGTCDTCDAIYDVGSRDGRCGDCGECAEHCEHKGSEE